jgi:hypothetical protein
LKYSGGQGGFFGGATDIFTARERKSPCQALFSAEHFYHCGKWKNRKSGEFVEGCRISLCKPFQGVFSAFVAIMALIVILFFLRNGFEQLFEIFRLDLLLLVMGIVLVSGLVICVTSTYFVVNKLVSFKKAELYY